MAKLGLSLRGLHVPKAGSTPEQYEDAYNFSLSSRTIAVADGATEAFESRIWARLLVDHAVQHPITRLSEEALWSEVDQLALEWSARIPWTQLTYFQGEKASRGSAATLLAFTWEDPLAAGYAADSRWQAVAVGDCCLFQIRDGQLQRRFPISRAADFGNRPSLLRTVGGTSVKATVAREEGTLNAGDLVMLMSDALAAWFLGQAEAGGTPWATLGSVQQDHFPELIQRLRSQRSIRNDDVTLVILEVSAKGVAGESPMTPSAVDRSRELARVPTTPPDMESTRPTIPPGPPRRPVELPTPVPAAGDGTDRQRGHTSASKKTRRKRRLLVGLLALVLLGASVLVVSSMLNARHRPESGRGGPALQTASVFLDRMVVFDSSNLDQLRRAVAPYVTSRGRTAMDRLLASPEGESARSTSTGTARILRVARAGDGRVTILALLSQNLSVTSAQRVFHRYLVLRLSLIRVGARWLVDSVDPVITAQNLIPSLSPRPSPPSTSPPGEETPTPSSATPDATPSPSD